jgi:hypothetical protein
MSHRKQKHDHSHGSGKRGKKGSSSRQADHHLFSQDEIEELTASAVVSAQQQQPSIH